MESVFLQQLSNPPSTAKGMTRWWWYGGAVTKAEIVKELDAMQQANIGGVELQVLFALQPDNAAEGVHNLAYGSPEFIEMVAFAASECKKRGMQFDFTPGSSWPFGGPFVSKEDAMQSAIPYQIDVQGPCTYHCDFTSRITGEVAAAMMGKMDGATMLPDTAVDITDKVKVKYLFGWPWGSQLEPVQIPEGTWKLVFFVVHAHRAHVEKPSRNAQGMIIDHCSKKALTSFWQSMVAPVAQQAEQNSITSFFCDSIEVEGHNWTGTLLDEFEKRRGYSLIPYLYALWGEMGGITPDVRYDYFQTMSELTLENFFDTFTELSHQQGSTSRIQAHGTWADILRAYAAADIPEGETFGDFCYLEANTIHRRLASSAGHLYGKPIISNETFTWLKKPRFTETPQDLKAAVDAVFVDGINAIVNHGFAYSPQNVDSIGYPFYASTHINHTIPWWPYYRHIASYIQRISAVLRTGHHVAEVAVYLPQADIWSDNLLSDLHMAMKLEEHIGRHVADNLQKAGYWFDYINDEALLTLGSITNGGLQIQNNSYKAILLIGCTRLPVATAQKLQEFAAQGGLLIATEQIPFQGCGLQNRSQNYAQVQASMQAAFSLPNAILVDDRHDSLITSLQRTLQPDVAIEANQQVGYVHRMHNNEHLYFVTNISAQEVTTAITFKNRQENPAVYNTETQQTKPLQSIQYQNQGCICTLTLHPFESVIFTFSPSNTTFPPLLPPIVKQPEALPLTGWEFCTGVDNTAIPMDIPHGWETIKGLEYYVGTGEYSSRFSIAKPVKRVVLQLTSLHCAATVWVNGSNCGDIWKKPYQLDITQHILVGENTIRIQVASSVLNHTLNPAVQFETFPKSIPEWPYFGDVINNERAARLHYAHEKESFISPQPAGLTGKVSLLVEFDD